MGFWGWFTGKDKKQRIAKEKERERSAKFHEETEAILRSGKVRSRSEARRLAHQSSLATAVAVGSALSYSDSSSSSSCDSGSSSSSCDSSSSSGCDSSLDCSFD